MGARGSKARGTGDAAGRPCNFAVMSIQRFAPEARLSGAVAHAGVLYLAGQVADDTSLDTEGQTADILAQIDALLAQAGTARRHLLSATVVLADIADAAAMNRAWDRWLDSAHKPARMTIQAPLVNPAWRVEITGIAAIPAPAPTFPEASNNGA